MWIRELKLSSWRNIESGDVRFQNGLNIVSGPNGAGKTNLLEAVNYLSQVRSFRRTSDRDLIARGTKQADIEGLFSMESETYSKTVSIRVCASSKAVSVDGKKAPTLSSFFGTVNVVSFDPRRVFLFRGEPSERRRVLDEILSSIYPKYLFSLSRYRKLLKQRNQALQQRMDEDVIGVLTRELISCAYRIVSNRADLVKRADEKARVLYRNLFGEGELEIRYRTDMPPTDDFETFRSEASDLFDRKRSIEAIRRSTALGPHLDDISCTIDGEPVQSRGSQGQNRLASLSFILAAASILGESRRDPPILVMDDVLSDLDEERRGRLLKEALSLGQTIISGTDEETIEGARTIRIEDGHIAPDKEENDG